MSPRIRFTLWLIIVASVGSTAGLAVGTFTDQGIPPCTSDDYNKDGVPLCYVVHEPTGTVIVLDEHDERVS